MPKSLKLAFIAEHFAVSGEGVENDLVKLCLALAGRGHQIHVVADDIEPREPIVGHLGLHRTSHHLRAIGPDVSIDWGLLHRADIHRIGGGVHQPFIPYNLLASPPASRWWRRLAYHKPKHRRIIARERDLLTDPGTRILAISRFIADHAIQAGANPAAVSVLYNGIDTNRFRPDSAPHERQRLRHQWGLGEDAIACLFIAHNLRLKNLDLLRQIFAELHAQHPELFLVVVGKRRPAWSAPYLVYHGHADDIVPVYAGGDLLLHPTWFDSFANVVFEAMSCALPVVVSDHAGITELIDDGSSGIVLPVAGRPAEVRRRWSAALAGLAVSPDLRQRLGAGGRQLAEAHAYERHVDEVEAALMGVAAVRAGR